MHKFQPHPRSIDWRFVKVFSPDDSAVAPSAPRALSLQEVTMGSGGEYYARNSGDRAGLGVAGRIALAFAGGNDGGLMIG